MTERDWLAGTSPEGMWQFMNSPRRRPDVRRMQFVRAALCRLVWTRLSVALPIAGFGHVTAVAEDLSAQAVDYWLGRLAPALAEADRTVREFAQTYTAAYTRTDDMTGPGPARLRQAEVYRAKAALREAGARHCGLQAMESALRGEEDSPLRLLLYYCRATVFQLAEAVQSRELARHCVDRVADNAPSFLRQLIEIQRRLPAPGQSVRSVSRVIHDLFGNPFRPVAFDPRWRTSDAVGLAQGIYEDRAFDRMPLLADALMDAGCADEQLIAHLREPGAHYRGCWVIDGVLGLDAVPAAR